MVAVPGERQNLILGPEAGGDQREAGEGQPANDESPPGSGHPRQEAAHVTHILRVFGVENTIGAPHDMFTVTLFLAVLCVLVCVMVAMLDTVNHAAGAKEQQCLEKGMRQQMEKCGHVCPHADGGHHIAELGDCGVGQYPLNIPLGHGDSSGK